MQAEPRCWFSLALRGADELLAVRQRRALPRRESPMAVALTLACIGLLLLCALFGDVP